MKVTVKHGAKSVELSIAVGAAEGDEGAPAAAAATSVGDFQALLTQHFGVATCHQKVVCSGMLLRLVADTAAAEAERVAREEGGGTAGDFIVDCTLESPIAAAFLHKCKVPHLVALYGVRTLVSAVDGSPPLAAAAPSSLAVAEAAAATQMLAVCSAVFAGRSTPIAQPCFAFEYFTKEGGPLMHVCGPCAHTCLSMADVAVHDSILQLRQPFTCQCCNILKTGHRCFWADAHRPMAQQVATLPQARALASRVVSLWDEQQQWFMQNIVRTLRKDLQAEQKAAQERLTSQLKQGLELFKQYSDPIAQDAARRVVPTQLLLSRVAGLRSAAAASGGGGPAHPHLSSLLPYIATLTDNELFLRELLRWFKHEFFTWVTNAPCDACGSKNTTAAPASHPTPEEVANWASMVETYLCQDCQAVTRLPRYNKAMRLLSFRKGRCGEWANCFCLLCIAMGYDTRYVLDLTDHVWVEVFVVTLDRWVHLDPCEDAFDTPHMYEEGWGKKLTYIFAYSTKEVLDVTRRYSQHPADLPMRTAVSEEFLSCLVAALDAERLATVPTPQIHRFAARRMKELDELARGVFARSAAAVTGRLTGSLEWKAQRGEDGGSAAGLDGDAAAAAAAAQPRTVEALELSLARIRHDLDLLRVVRKELAAGGGELAVASGSAGNRRPATKSALLEVSCPGGVECTADGLVFPLITVGARQPPAVLRTAARCILPWGFRLVLQLAFVLPVTSASSADDADQRATMFATVGFGDVFSTKITLGDVETTEAQKKRSSGDDGQAPPQTVKAVTSVDRYKFYRDDASTPTHVMRSDLQPLTVTAPVARIEEAQDDATAAAAAVRVSLIMTLDKTSALVTELRSGDVLGEDRSAARAHPAPVAVIGTLMPLMRRKASLFAASLAEGNLTRHSLDATGSFEAIQEQLALSGCGVVVTGFTLTAAFSHN